MSDDFCKLWQEAIGYELKYGEDKSHGNLLRTPINRLIEYQKYFYDTEFPLLTFGAAAAAAPASPFGAAAATAPASPFGAQPGGSPGLWGGPRR